MPFYPRDFFNAVVGESRAVKWAYFCALCYYWSHAHCEGLQDIDRKLMGICECTLDEWVEVKPLVFGEYFKLDENGLWQQKRAREVWARACEAHAARVAGGRKRWGKS